MRPEVRTVGPARLFRGLDRLSTVGLQDHRRLHPLPPRLPLRELLELAEGADLRGRGGAAFPFARKLRAVSAAARERGTPTVVLVNIAEHESQGGCGRPVLGVLPVPGGSYEEPSGLRLGVDWSRCTGHGLCGRLVPDLMPIDEFGYPMPTEAGIPAHRLPDAIMTAEMCPALALELERVHG